MGEFKYHTLIPDVEFWKGMVPCQAACPVNTDAGRYVQLIAQGKYEDAYFVARSPNPLASVCGRICAAPCEDRCRRGKLDAPVSIRALKRFVTERFGVESMEPDTQDKLRTGQNDVGNKVRGHLPILQASPQHAARNVKAAVIGAGPAGLACAHDLALMGYQVTIFEATRQAGGMMFHGIPEFRLARPIIEKEISKIENLGVEIRYHTPLTAEFGLQELREEGYRAVFLSVGVQKGRDLRIEGAQLDGVIKAVDYLININNGYRVNLGKKVLVIGGGFVAFDAARLALRAGLEAAGAVMEEEHGGELKAALDAARAAVRAGATEVHMVSLESFDELPVMRTTQGKEEFEEAHREGIIFHPQRSARRFIGANGRVQEAEFIGVKRTYDEQGRFNPEYDERLSETLAADSIILAIGQQADLSFLKPQDNVALTPQGTIKVDRETLATSAPGLFAGGDVAFGPRNLIEAVANGKRAALSMDDYLRGATMARTAFNLFLPLLVLALFSWHMWRVCKDGGLACVDKLSLAQKREKVTPIKSKTYSLLGITSGATVHVETSLIDENKHTVPASPTLTRRLLLVTLATTVVTAVLSVIFHAPLEEAANPAVTPNPAKAPWYFLWLQELVTVTTINLGGFTINGALIGGIIIPGLLVAAAIVWPYLDKSSVRSVGVWFAKERRKQNLVFLLVVAGILIFTIIGTYLRGPYWNWYWPWEQWPVMPRKF